MKKALSVLCVCSLLNINASSFFNTPLLLSKTESISKLRDFEKISNNKSNIIKKKQKEKKTSQKPFKQKIFVRNVAPIMAANMPPTSNTSSDNEEDLYSSLRMFAEVLDLVERKGFKKPGSFREFIEGGLVAAVPSVDAHSAFFPKQSYDQTKESTSGKFPGIGITIVSKPADSDELVITDVIEGGPAHKAGLQSGDKIIKINDDQLRGLSSDEVIAKLRGKINSIVLLKVIRDKKLLEFDVKREMIKNQVTTSYFFENQNIHYVGLRLFTENAAKCVADVLKKVDKGCKGIILDLRRNGGGILESVVETAGLFLKKNSLVVSTKNRDGKTVSEYNTTADPLFNSNIPIFMLIDNFTASAAEILAGCLKHYSSQATKDHKNLMVFLLGSPTFGKGSVQEVIPISNGCALKLTTMLYYLPGDISIQASGIQPDFNISPRIVPENELKILKELSGTESSLKHHIKREEALKNTGHPFIPAQINASTEKEESWDEKFKKRVLKDFQVQKAASMISLIHMAKKHTPNKINTREKAISFLKKSLLSDDTLEIKK
ncbi:S41 family peptidase [Candidatus Babeliales bacterium]|nr:S41 family peptidase [Candidatus Babeliales bacterium]